MRKPVVLGADLGEKNTALGILGDRAILYSMVLPRAAYTWDEYCCHFRDEIQRLIRKFHVDILAVEDFSWRGYAAAVESPVRELIGITRTFSQTVPVVVVPAPEWQAAITGTRPTRRDQWNPSRTWKQTIRAALRFHLAAMGVDLDVAVGRDGGNHKTDSLALALFIQDTQHIHSFAQEAPQGPRGASHRRFTCHDSPPMNR